MCYTNYPPNTLIKLIIVINYIHSYLSIYNCLSVKVLSLHKIMLFMRIAQQIDFTINHFRFIYQFNIQFTVKFLMVSIF